MADYNFIEYTPETAEAIKKARSLPPSGSHLSPYPDIQKQQMLNPPQQMIEGSGSEITGPFDVKIENGSVIVYDSSNSNSNRAGYVKIGSHNYSMQKTTVAIANTGTLYLNAVYTTNSGISFTFQIGQYPQTDSRQQYTLRMAEITNDGTQYNISRTRLPGDIEILGRWFE